MTPESGKQTPADGERQVPRVFLSYASENKELAGQVANALMKNAIATWWDDWEVRAGDSIRQKVDDGIKGCTHFLVLLTPQSINKTWVNTEMDAAFFSKLEGKCRFIPARYGLAADKLPPTLRGLLSPEIESGTDTKKLVNTIYGVSEKPSRGQPPAAVLQADEIKTGYSDAATAIARAFVEKSKTSDTIIHVMLSVDEIMKKTGLNIEDVEDAYHELKDDGFLEQGRKYIGWSVSNPSDNIAADLSLFSKFGFFAGWNTEEDAKQIAVDMLNNNKFPAAPEAIANHYSWEMCRLEPAISWLSDHGFVKIHTAIDAGIGFCVEPKRSALRRFVRGME